MATTLSIEFLNQGRFWRIVFGVNGKVEPTGVFGCRDGILPMVAALRAAELEYDPISATSKTDPRRGPPTIAVSMPSGRVLTFALMGVDPGASERPEAPA